MIETYLLDENGEPMPEPNLVVWARGLTNKMKRIARDELDDGVVVSTCFLGMDHRFGRPGPPLLYETTIFGLDIVSDEYQERYATEVEARIGHAQIVIMVMLQQSGEKGLWRRPRRSLAKLVGRILRKPKANQ